MWLGWGHGWGLLGLRMGLGGASTVRKGRPKALVQLSGLERSWSIVLETRAYLCGVGMSLSCSAQRRGQHESVSVLPQFQLASIGMTVVYGSYKSAQRRAFHRQPLADLSASGLEKSSP